MAFQILPSTPPATLALATLNGQAYLALSSELKRRGIRYVSLKPGEPAPLTVKAVITTPPEAEQVKHPNLILFEGGDAARLVDRALTAALKAERLTVGVDPGETFGLAILGDGETLIHAGSYRSLESLLEAVKEWVQSLKPTLVRVKLGARSPEASEGGLGRRIQDALAEIFHGGLELLYVDEKGTTNVVKRMRLKRKDKDKLSAIYIALRQV